MGVYMAKCWPVVFADSTVGVSPHSKGAESVCGKMCAGHKAVPSVNLNGEKHHV